MKKASKTLLLLILTLPFLPVSAQRLITLQEAIQTGLNKNPRVNQLISQLEQKSVELKSLIGLEDPIASYVREGVTDDGTIAYNEQRFQIYQQVQFPLTTVYQKQALQKEKQAMEIELDAVRKEISTNIKRYYIDVLYAIHLEELRLEERKLAHELFQAVQLRKENGVGTEMDYLAAELNYAEAENEINDADRYLHQSRYTLFNYMGLDPAQQNYDIEFQDSLITREELIEQEKALEDLINHPEYLAKSALISAQESVIKAERSGFLPDINLGYLRQDFGAGYQYSGVEFGLSLPLWGGWKQKGMIQGAQLKREELTWVQTATFLDLKKRIELAWHSYENSKVILDRYLSGMRQKATRLRELSLEAYQLGQIDLLKLIEAQRLYLSGQRRYLEALHDYYLRLAELEYFVPVELVY